MKMCIVMLGAPCSGKSTIGKKLANYLNVPYISSGDIARHIASTNEEVRKQLDNGEMCPEDIMRDTIKTLLTNINNLVLDGFPRFEEQKQWLEDNIDHQIFYVYISVSMIQAYNRSYIRHRSDDAAFHVRYKYYIENTKPMIDSMLHSSIVCCVDNDNDIKGTGDDAVNVIIDRIIDHIKSTKEVEGCSQLPNSKGTT